MADLARMRAAEPKEWEARQNNPASIEVTAEECRDYKWPGPLLGRIDLAFREIPEVKAAINTQREALDLPPLA